MLIDSEWLPPIPDFVTLYTGQLENSSLLSYAELSNVDTSHDTQSKLNALMSMLTSSKTNKQTKNTTGTLIKYRGEDRSFPKA